MLTPVERMYLFKQMQEWAKNYIKRDKLTYWAAISAKFNTTWDVYFDKMCAEEADYFFRMRIALCRGIPFSLPLPHIKDYAPREVEKSQQFPKVSFSVTEEVRSAFPKSKISSWRPAKTSTDNG